MEHQADEVDSRPLPESFAPDGHAVVDALDAYYRESVGGRQPVIHQERLARNIEQLDLATLVREGGLAGPRLETFVRDYLAATTRLHHPAFLAHQVAAPHPTGSLASLIDGFTNNAMAIYEMGPGAASIEFFVINWMLEKIGWQPAPVEGDATAPAVPRDGRAAHAADDPPIGGGVLTHGGSLANLTALLAARRQIAPDSWRTGTPNDLVLFAPAVSHYSIARAAGILGLGQDAVWPLEVDDRGATIAERLPAVLGAARAAGKRPLAVVANSCNTPVGAYDPLLPIGEFCRRHGIWLHVDGAHGASALVSPTHRHLLDGIELADSLTWDAHKMLRAPTLCAALLVRVHRPRVRPQPAGVRVPRRPIRHEMRRAAREQHPVLPRRRQRHQAVTHPRRAQRRGQLLPVLHRVSGAAVPAHGGDQPRDLAGRHRTMRGTGARDRGRHSRLEGPPGPAMRIEAPSSRLPSTVADCPSSALSHSRPPHHPHVPELQAAKPASPNGR